MQQKQPRPQQQISANATAPRIYSNRRNLPDKESIYQYWLRQDDWINPHQSIPFPHLFIPPRPHLPGGNPHPIYACFACGAPNTVRAHIKARHQGGNDQENNLHLLCHGCHQESELLFGESYNRWIRTKIRRNPNDITAQMMGYHDFANAWDNELQHIAHPKHLHQTGWPRRFIQIRLGLEYIQNASNKEKYKMACHLYGSTIHAQIQQQPHQHTNTIITHTPKYSHKWKEYIKEYGPDIYTYICEEGTKHIFDMLQETHIPPPPKFKKWNIFAIKKTISIYHDIYLTAETRNE